MHHHGRRREVVRNGETRLQRLPVQQQLVVIPAKSCGDGPIMKMDEILNKDRLLQIGPVIGKDKGWGRSIVKACWIGNVVSKIFVQKCVIRLHAGLPLMTSAI